MPLPPHWGGYRVVPETIEFWQGRENRLHDRIRYVRERGGRGGGWSGCRREGDVIPDLRDTIFNTWRTSNRVTVFLVEHLPPELWDAVMFRERPVARSA